MEAFATVNMMRTWRIHYGSTMMVAGEFTAVTPRGALNEYAITKGYVSWADMADQLGFPEDFTTRHGFCVII